ncbi:MAG: SAM-dependent methyltransferase [Phycisphaerales bacterium]|nr:methyltransferase domain-containing protein [Phycisphaerales bacterium]
MAAVSTPESQENLHQSSESFVSRGGLKLAHALDTFALTPHGMTCADLGCSTGGFTDCLLQRGAAKVYSVDTAYGQLAWKLRSDDRVVVMERSNALHTEPVEQVDLVVIDLGWTVQKLAIPAAARWLKPDGCIVTLIKPHYEHTAHTHDRNADIVLTPEVAERIAHDTVQQLESMGYMCDGLTPSPVIGGARQGKKRKGTGNIEYLALVRCSS